ncbi:MAG: hypothetical protein EA350_12965 [Gemmatimonadales bacterium]|nr:MAG: hypothetical protein EA350_12965 [Gemmatimonadales bacterium]
MIDDARRHRTAKGGGGGAVAWLGDAEPLAEERSESFTALEEALARLATFDRRLSRVVECRFHHGLTEVETGAALGISARTAHRDWLRARRWLYHEIHGGG